MPTSGAESSKQVSHNVLLLRAIFVSFCTLLLVSCGATGSTPGQSGNNYTGDQQGEFWAVELHVTGGKAGLGRSIYVGSNGKLIVKDVRKKLYVENILKSEVLEDFADLVPDKQTIKLSAAGRHAARTCQTCTYYELAYQRDTEKGRTQTTGRELARSQYKALIHKLGNIQDEIIRRYSRRK